MGSDIILRKLRNRKVVKQVITYQGQKVIQWIQINKETEDISWMVYHLPISGDKSQAIMHNYSLRLKEVVRLINTTSNN